MEKDPMLRLRVFDLNCWAICYLSKRRQERISLIGDQLCREGFDLVLLQEIWSERDYSNLKAKLGGCCPFSHYFRSGVIGSGLCVFSKFPILDTLLYQYSLNGYPYMLQHGDWFCGKSVGLVIVRIAEITVNIYVTHLHAEYSREKDAYLPHRVVQAWELAQFIRHTAKAADVVLLGGDLNMHPGDVGIRLLRSWTGLRDAFTEAQRFEAVSSFTVECEELRTTTGTVPGLDIPYSDHEAVMAVLCIQRRQQTASVTIDAAMPALLEVLSEARTEVCMGLLAARQQRYSSGRMAVLAMLLLLLQAVGVLGMLGGVAAAQPFPALSVSLLAFFALAILLFAAGLHLFHSIEVKMLQGTEEQMEMAMRGLQEQPLHH
ncbi:sphingomyelin phosphodiesterase 2 isoform X2 [Cyrtonyx montezumae]|uniref:sphingomyelin phosphodiesterase 2 isoform X2 n=1 Tax=Cyrtonyx montezumae TaxID=9017 RepID=UPI0032DB0ACC